MTPMSLHWTGPLVSGGVCMLIFPLWMFLMPDAGASASAAGWQLGLNVLLYYPPAAARLFFFSRLHRWTVRKAARPRIDLLYLAAVHVALLAAMLTMAFAMARILV